MSEYSSSLTLRLSKLIIQNASVTVPYVYSKYLMDSNLHPSTFEYNLIFRAHLSIVRMTYTRQLNIFCEINSSDIMSVRNLKSIATKEDNSCDRHMTSVSHRVHIISWMYSPVSIRATFPDL